ncbi:MAG: prepilin-type N-terminal cleavage/methylation domain-containing protein [Desulfomonile tiedjei]|uniref:Prepilin-type N-terminal cleavage/methylation domain-containing protein n=1 Tax=Desulfomonile tiedjei TaxID=2358 RepID=A0A9D6V4X5_9BACT|nr:prepilin-type N-terminal cleavage/methylation domain-containing protein [Desulfomonile tiedjei]
MRVGSEKGFSLIEVMVAIGILFFGMAGVGSMLFQSFQFDRNNAKQRRAQIAANQIAERFRGGNPPTREPNGSGTAQRLPPTSSDFGNGIIIGTDLWWQDATKTNGTYFCQWTTYSPSGSLVHDWTVDGSVPESGSVTDITIGWGSGDCSRSSVNTCPRKFRMVVILTKK